MPQDRTSADEGLFVPNPESNQGLSTATADGNPDDNAENTDATMDKVQDSALNVESNPYTKVDYKKRYDDLKRYYDRKLGEWNSKESDLKVQLKRTDLFTNHQNRKKSLKLLKTIILTFMELWKLYLTYNRKMKLRLYKRVRRFKESKYYFTTKGSCT